MATRYISDLRKTTTSGDALTVDADRVVIGPTGYIAADEFYGTGIGSNGQDPMDLTVLGGVYGGNIGITDFDFADSYRNSAGDATVTVGSGAVVEGGATGIWITGSGAQIVVNGTVAGSGTGLKFYWIDDLNLDAGLVSSPSVTIGGTGMVLGGITFSGSNSWLSNSGVISSEGSAIWVNDYTAVSYLFSNYRSNSRGNTVMNDGLIEAGGTAIDMDPVYNARLVNSGTITGETGAVFGDGAHVTNTGTISASKNGVRLISDRDRSADDGRGSINNSGSIEGGEIGIQFDGLDYSDRSFDPDFYDPSYNSYQPVTTGTPIDVGTSALLNSGLVSGSTAVDAGEDGTVFIRNSGTIDGTTNAIVSNGADVIVSNSGTIRGEVALGAGDDRIVNRGSIEAALIDMGGGDDRYDGSAAAAGAVVNGNEGNDALIGGEGSDRLFGGEGDDTFMFSGGVDLLAGGEGRDGVSFILAESAVTVNLGGQVTGRGASRTTITGIEDVTGTSFDDLVGGDSGANRLIGLGGKDTLFAGGGADVLDGGSGDDTLLGGGGNDLLIGGAGVDVLDGGTGNDTAFYGYESGPVSVNLNTGVNNQNDTLTSIENVTGGAGADVLGGTGGANRLKGGAGNDLLFAGGGADVLDGGSGTNTLLGGRGADVFVITKASAGGEAVRDVVRDFTDGTDLIDLRAFGIGATADEDVRANANVTQQGADLVINFYGIDTVVRLQNTTDAQITDADFLL